MKYLLPLILFSFLVSCSQANLSDAELRMRIVEIHSTGRGGVHGRWVILSPGVILTSRHVVEDCRDPSYSWTWETPSRGCSVSIEWWQQSISTLVFPDTRRDIATLSYIREGNLKKSWYDALPLVSSWSLIIGQEIYTLTTTGRIMGKILALAPSYIGYDVSLSWRLLSWSIMSDIVLGPGESGTPVWTWSGMLIGVMSAVDPIGKRSYIVQ